MDYHEEFMRTQDIASNFARKFNEALVQIERHFGKECWGTLRKLPRIHFLEPMVVEVMENDKEKNILIERFLDGDYKKFNSNMGYVEKEVEYLLGRLSCLGVRGGVDWKSGGGAISDGLGAIVEGSEEESDEEEQPVK